MQIVELRVSNVKRVHAVRFKPDPAARVIRVTGPNGAGKTSVIDSIAYAIGGGKMICTEPLRAGEDSGSVTVDLGAVVVTRRWQRHRHTGVVSSTLEVRGADGLKLSRAQQLLDSLLGELSFDPLQFVREPAKRQLELVRQLVGLDFAQLDAERATAYSDRTVIGRQLKAAEAEAFRQPLHPDTPEQPQDLGALVAEIEQAHATHAAAAAAREAEGRAGAARGSLESELANLRGQIQQLQAREQELARRWHELDAVLEQARVAAEAAAERAIDPAPLRARLAEVEVVNRRVRENRERAAAHEQVKRLAAEQEQLTNRITAIDVEKERRAAAAVLPVAGLAFRHDGLLLGGVPFEQASAAEQIRVSVAMGAALHPELRVLLVRDGSLLGEDALELLGATAAEQGLQVWLERVAEPGAGESGGDVLVIEDGEAVFAEAA